MIQYKVSSYVRRHACMAPRHRLIPAQTWECSTVVRNSNACRIARGALRWSNPSYCIAAAIIKDWNLLENLLEQVEFMMCFQKRKRLKTLVNWMFFSLPIEVHTSVPSGRLSHGYRRISTKTFNFILSYSNLSKALNYRAFSSIIFNSLHKTI